MPGKLVLRDKYRRKIRLRELRQAGGLSHVELGEKIGVSRQTIYAIEIGEYDPSLPLTSQTAEEFDRRIEDIFYPDR